MRLYFLLLFILFITNCFTQDKFSKDDLLALTIPITSTPSSDFSDLTFLKSKIDTSLPIFLGESSHTIGDYNRLRVRMIKYLHEQLNYNVIAFEAPFANLKYVSENRNNLTVEKMLKMGLFYIWKTSDLLDLMNYLKTHPKLKIMGIDCQESNIDSLVISAYTSKIESKNSQLARQYVHLLNRFKILMKSNPFEYSSNNLSENKQVIQQIDSLQKLLLNNNLANFDLQFHLQNLKNNCVNYAMFKPFFSKANQYRDSVMAENYLTLTSNLFSNEKVIVWGHNAHLSKKSMDKEYPKSMGEFLSQKIKFNAIGLYAYGGTYGYGFEYENRAIKKPSKKYLEYYLHKNDFDISYVDFRNIPVNSWLHKSFKTLDTRHGVMSIIPGSFFDAVIFFHHVEASKYLKLN
jgi:erythromycin esterase